MDYSEESQDGMDHTAFRGGLRLSRPGNGHQGSTNRTVSLVQLGVRAFGSSTSQRPQAAPMIPLVYHRRYNITAFGLERLHPFDSRKYRRIHDALIARGLRLPAISCGPDRQHEATC